MRQCTKFAQMLIVLLPLWNGTLAHAVTLKAVEQVALDTAPELSQLRSKEQALREAAIAAGQLPDPKLHGGIINVPTNSFSLTQENMTQIKIGIAQAFPKGRSLSISSKQKRYFAQAEHFREMNMREDILLAVRNEWLNLYYWTHAADIVEKNRDIFLHLVKVTESILASGKSNQHDVLRAQLELSQIKNRQIQIEEQLVNARTRLARWIGEPMANNALPAGLPKWPLPPNQKILTQKLLLHPNLQTDISLIDASRAGVQLAKQQYKPGLLADVSYSLRQGDNSMTNKRRADFIGAQISLDLPVFTGKRQDKQLASNLADLNASEDAKVSNFRKMKSNLGQYWVDWEKLSQQVKLYQQRLIPEANYYAKATLTAYQNDLSDFPAVARAYVIELNTQLDALKIEVDRSKARVGLLYMEGSNQ